MKLKLPDPIGGDEEVGEVVVDIHCKKAQNNEFWEAEKKESLKLNLRGNPNFEFLYFISRI